MTSASINLAQELKDTRDNYPVWRAGECSTNDIATHLDHLRSLARKRASQALGIKQGDDITLQFAWSILTVTEEGVRTNEVSVRGAIKIADQVVAMLTERLLLNQ